MSKHKQKRSRVNKPKYQAYKNGGVRERNKAYKILRHLERYPDDKQSKKAFESLSSTHRAAATKRRNKELTPKSTP